VDGSLGLGRPTCQPIVSAMTTLADIEVAALRQTDKERLHLADKLLGRLLQANPIKFSSKLSSAMRSWNPAR
jgi:hypothetical protein